MTMPLLPTSSALPLAAEGLSASHQMVLDLHTREIESFYRTQQQEQLQGLKDSFEREVGKLRAKLERDIVEVNSASQRAVQAEIENFRLHRLPAITSLLTAPGSQMQPPQSAPLTSMGFPVGMTAAEAFRPLDAVVACTPPRSTPPPAPQYR